MSKPWRLISGCAVLGLLITTVVVVQLNTTAVFDVRLYTACVIFCPPSLLCIPFLEVMHDKGVFYAIWSMIGLANSGLYAIIGAALAGQLWKAH